MCYHYYSLIIIFIRLFNISIISSLILESKFPVGSSASTIDDLVISALAIETLCCCPPDNSLGK